MQTVDRLHRRGRVIEGLGDRALRYVHKLARTKRGVGIVLALAFDRDESGCLLAPEIRRFAAHAEQQRADRSVARGAAPPFPSPLK